MRNRTNSAMRNEKMKQIAAMAEAGLVTSLELAEALSCTPRTIYRYVAAMRVLGVQIDGEPGCGYLIAPKKQIAKTSKDFGTELVSFMMARQPACMRGGAEEVAVTLNALADTMGAILAGVEVAHGRATMLKVMDYYQTRVFNSAIDIRQKGGLYAAEKPIGAQGEN